MKLETPVSMLLVIVLYCLPDDKWEAWGAPNSNPSLGPEKDSLWR